MNPDTIQNDLLLSAVQNDSISSQQADSSTFKIDRVISDPQTEKTPKRFITEKQVSPKMPETGTNTLVPAWITFLLLGAFFLLAILNFLHRKNFIQVLKATAVPKQILQLLREGNPLSKQFTIILAFIYLISIPLLFYSIVENYYPNHFDSLSQISTYFLFLFLLLGFFIYKSLFIQLTALLFQTQKPSFELLINLLIFNLAIGVLILPFIALFIYTQQIIILQISMGIYGLAILLRTIRVLQVGVSKSIFSILHLFLYLCTLEFVPAIIVGKMLISYYIQ